MARRRKSLRERIVEDVIRIAGCGILLAVVLIGIKFFTRYVETKLVAEDDVLLAEEDSEEPEQDTSQESGGIFTVCIDAGHGGKDLGSDFNGRIEKDDNLALALKVQEELKEQNVNVVMTRDKDVFLKLSERCRISNKAKADYFVSLHRNKGDGYGIESWLYSNANEESLSLAENITKGVEQIGISRNRGISYGSSESPDSDYYVNSHSEAPSLILEMGFVNSSEDNKLLDEHLDEYAKAIADAIVKTYDTYHKTDIN